MTFDCSPGGSGKEKGCALTARFGGAARDTARIAWIQLFTTKND